MSNIIIIGFMASGKSTLGKKLANKLKYQFIDTDVLIEQQEGKTVTEIFAQEGENYFRERENQLLDQLAKLDRQVIATGGGLPCYHENMSKLKQFGITVYLRTSAHQIVARLLQSKTDRPLVSGKTNEELEDFVKDLLNKREKFYNQAKFHFFGKEQRLPNLIEVLSVELD